MIFPLIAFVLIALVQGNPLQGRGNCNQDNCLRALQHSASLASPFCSTYYTKTITTVTTTTIPALDATFPALKAKRGAQTPPVTARAAAATPTPDFPAKCTEASTALSSGCSCILGPGAATTTLTHTSTHTLPLPQECSSKSSYGLYPTSLGIVALPNGVGAGGLGFEVYPGGCCAYCHASPNCVFYYEDTSYVAQQPGKVECSIQILGDPVILPLGHPTCPLGVVSLTKGVSETSILWGAGPCATVIN